MFTTHPISHLRRYTDFILLFSVDIKTLNLYYNKNN